MLPSESDEVLAKDRERNTVLTSLAGSMRRRGMTEAAIQSALLIENTARCKPPLRKEDVQEIAISVARYEPDSAADVHLTDLGNARRLVDSHGDDLRYCAAWRTWLVWDGKRWAKDQTGEVERRAKRTIQDLYLAVAATADLEASDNLARPALA